MHPRDGQVPASRAEVTQYLYLPWRPATEFGRRRLATRPDREGGLSGAEFFFGRTVMNVIFSNVLDVHTRNQHGVAKASGRHRPV
ncbi:hypothetical protein ACQKWADRAFT_83471 [Trichoderma austrokoningii]